MNTNTNPARAAITPVLLTENQAAELLGIGVRKFGELRVTAAWLPKPIELGPRALRWMRDELIEALATRSPRLTEAREPAQLRRARIERLKAGPTP